MTLLHIPLPVVLRVIGAIIIAATLTLNLPALPVIAIKAGDGVHR